MSLDQTCGVKVEVTDVKTKTSTTYHAIRAAARALSIDKRYIENYLYLNQDKPVLDKYTFKLINRDNENSLPGRTKTQKTSKQIEVTNVESKKVTLYVERPVFNLLLFKNNKWGEKALKKIKINTRIKL